MDPLLNNESVRGTRGRGLRAPAGSATQLGWPWLALAQSPTNRRVPVVASPTSWPYLGNRYGGVGGGVVWGPIIHGLLPLLLHVCALKASGVYRRYKTGVGQEHPQ